VNATSRPRNNLELLASELANQVNNPGSGDPPAVSRHPLAELERSPYWRTRTSRA
jgi:hypothetical protein